MVVVVLLGTTLGGAVGGKLGNAGVGVGVTVTVKIGMVGSGMGVSGEGCKIHWWRCSTHGRWGNVDTPEACTCWLSVTMKNLVAPLVPDNHLVFVKEGCAIRITQFATADKVVIEAKHDVACVCEVYGNGWEG